MQRNSINGVLIISGTIAERATLAANIAGKGTEFWESDGSGNKYLSNGTSWLLFETGGAAHVRPIPGTGEATKSRNINAAATTYATATNTATWTSTDNVTEVTVTVKAATAAGIQNDEFCLIAFDAPSTATAAAWLADTGGAAVNVMYDIIPVGQSRTYNFPSYLSRVDVLPLNDTMRVVLAAN